MFSRNLFAARLPTRVYALLAGLLLLMIAGPALVADVAQPDWLAMGFGLFGGLAMFLYGMDQLTASLKAAAGEQMKTLLGKLCSNRVTGAISGAVVTAVIQSSSVTTVLVVGFVSAGLITMTQSIGIIFAKKNGGDNGCIDHHQRGTPCSS